MNFYLTDDIFEFYDLSIVMPFYKKLKEFKKVLPKNLPYFQRNGIELIIVLDTPEEEKELIVYLREFPFLNATVIINRDHHEWRNPSRALNVGIRHATRKYVFVASPETEYVTDVIYQLRYILHYYPGSFAIGQVVFSDFDSSPSAETLHDQELLPYGSLMVEKRYLEEIRGYAEQITGWGGDDDNIRARLELAGLKKMFVSQAIAIHREEDSPGHKSRYKKNAEMPVRYFKDIFHPADPVVNEENWGTDFNEIAYQWQLRSNKYEQCKNYLKSFKKYWLSDASIFDKSYKVIALLQVKNEIRHIPEVLLHLDQYCDGIILLDDDSTDGSYENAVSQKLLLKVQKNGSDKFDDLALRNITLELASFFNSSWLFFFDADERFDPRYADLYAIDKKSQVDSVCFFVVHLWNHNEFYRIDLPEKKTGLLTRFRMFRSFGMLQITANRILHFPATPFKKNRLDSSILIRHFGNVDPATRRMKYERYTREDKEGMTQGYTYEYLIEEDVVLKKVDELVL